MVRPTAAGRPLSSFSLFLEREQAGAVPDLRTQKDRSFGQGDWVCLETTSSGTHKGPLLGPGGQAIPATGKSFRMKVAGVFKLERRRITEVHEYFDLAGFMAQLGLSPR